MQQAFNVVTKRCNNVTNGLFPLILRLFFQEFLQLSGLLLKLLGLEAVTGTGNDVETSILVKLLGALRIINEHHLVFVTLHDKYGPTILADDFEGIHVVNLLKEAASHLHAPQLSHLGDVRQLRIAGAPVLWDAESGEYKHQLTNLILHLCGGEGRHQSALTLTNEHDMLVTLAAEIVDDGTQVALLVEYRHIQRVIVRTAVDRAAGEVEDVALVAQFLHHVEVASSIMVCAVEAVSDDTNWFEI